MAEAKKEKQKKSGGKGKKILIAFIAIAVVVGIVLAIVLSRPKESNKTVKALNKISESSIIDNEEMAAQYDAFYAKIEGNATVSYYRYEMNQMRLLTDAVDDVADYYNEYYIFAKNNKVKKANSKKINSAIKKVQSTQKKLNAILKETKNLESSSHLQNAWVEYRRVYAQQFEAYTKLFKSLNKVYHGSLGNTVVVNTASKNLLNIADDFMVVLGEKLDNMVKYDIEGSKESDYAFNYYIHIQRFQDFTTRFLYDSEMITEYYYNDTYMKNHERLSKFTKLYGEKSYAPVIRSIISFKNTYLITYEKSGVEDPESVLQLLKNFL